MPGILLQYSLDGKIYTFEAKISSDKRIANTAMGSIFWLPTKKRKKKKRQNEIT